MPQSPSGTSAQPQFRWWWNNAQTVDQLARWLTERKTLSTADDVLTFFKNPSAFNKEFELFNRQTLQTRSATRKRTSEFFDDRFYPIGDDWLESITTILWAYPAPELVRFIGSVGNEEAEIRKRVAAERGSKVHDGLQQNSILSRDFYSDEEWLSLIHAKMFHEQYNPKLVLNEQWCWSTKHHYAGRFDRIVLIDGKITLIDWKTGYVGREAWLQLAAEVRAIEEMYPIKIDSWGIVALNARVKAGWKYYSIEEQAGIEGRISQLSMQYLGETVSDVKAITGDSLYKRAHREALAERLKEDLDVFDALHAVWRDVFGNLKPRQYPIFPVPDSVDLSIPFHELPEDIIPDEKVVAVKSESLPSEPAAAPSGQFEGEVPEQPKSPKKKKSEVQASAPETPAKKEEASPSSVGVGTRAQTVIQEFETFVAIPRSKKDLEKWMTENRPKLLQQLSLKEMEEFLMQRYTLLHKQAPQS